MKLEDLQRFCAHESRPELSRPISLIIQGQPWIAVTPGPYAIVIQTLVEGSTSSTEIRQTVIDTLINLIESPIEGFPTNLPALKSWAGDPFWEPVVCPSCRGVLEEVCTTCHGTGEEECECICGNIHYNTCPDCDGNSDSSCRICDGKGTTTHPAIPGKVVNPVSELIINKILLARSLNLVTDEQVMVELKHDRMVVCGTGWKVVLKSMYDTETTDVYRLL